MYEWTWYEWNKRVLNRIHEYKSVGGYVKQMREETEKLKIWAKNCLDRKLYEKKIKETRFLWKIKKNGRVLRGRRKGSKGTQKWWEDAGIKEKWKWERKSNYIRVVFKGRFMKKKIIYSNIHSLTLILLAGIHRILKLTL